MLFEYSTVSGVASVSGECLVGLPAVRRLVEEAALNLASHGPDAQERSKLHHVRLRVNGQEVFGATLAAKLATLLEALNDPTRLGESVEAK